MSTDRRMLAANARVAAAELEGVIDAPAYVDGTHQMVSRPVVDLLAAPAGARDRQLLYGQGVRVFEVHDGWAFCMALRDGYVGYVRASDLMGPIEATHVVAVPATHAYPVPDFKQPPFMHLSLGSRFRVVGASGAFFETAEGYFIPKPHLRPANKPFTDVTAVAQLFFGAPYLWGGNSVLGIDCSGLVQAAHLACGIPCQGDSDQQMRALGDPLGPDDPLQRGDLLFWKGHVALAVDADTIIHANAHHMAVAYEGFLDACARIAEAGEGPLLAHKRLVA
ncbi:NlpC/P60 family protein [Rhodovulum sp. FJ3]|uniref:C40 family peptidase n=1 Tax=Rhodovulum sp. FJ3 TaxID=3079053 RepID=UPI00293DB227|nr:NlpC/P60 family protein [Rhodovulum sp. FJ3]MDV4168954.1 NlpC/P60 family protein [Rhodovulum sp. FJ3]